MTRATALAVAITVGLGLPAATPAGAASSVPSASSARPSTRTVRAADGVPIAFDVRGRGKVAVVLLHCWACDRTFWKEQVEPLSRRFTVVALDLAGHGDSGDGRARFTVSGLGGDVQAVVEALKLERVVLVGHSLGGPVALDAARRMPGRVAGVVAVDTLHDVEQRASRETVGKLEALYEEDFPGTMAAMVRRMFPRDADPAAVDYVLGRAMAARPGPALSLMRDYPEIDAAAWMEAARVPVRAINSGPPVSPVTKIGHNRRHGNYDVSFLDGTGHYPMLERPAEFERRLEAAIGEVLAASARPAKGLKAAP